VTDATDDVRRALRALADGEVEAPRGGDPQRDAEPRCDAGTAGGAHARGSGAENGGTTGTEAAGAGTGAAPCRPIDGGGSDDAGSDDRDGTRRRDRAVGGVGRYPAADRGADDAGRGERRPVRDRPSGDGRRATVAGRAGRPPRRVVAAGHRALESVRDAAAFEASGGVERLRRAAARAEEAAVERSARRALAAHARLRRVASGSSTRADGDDAVGDGREPSGDGVAGRRAADRVHRGRGTVLPRDAQRSRR
jgi:hypothetical protein